MVEFLYDNYDTVIVLACLGAAVVAALLMAVVFFVYYRGRDEVEDTE